MTSGTVRTIGGFPIVASTTGDLIRELRARRARGERTELLFANTNFVVGCHPLVDRLQAPQTLIVNDGIGLDLASRLLHGEPFPENLNGTDFTPRFLAGLDRPTRLFLLGARPEALRATARRWSGLSNVEIVGTADGYEDLADPATLLARLRATTPDVLLVALGDPRQAEWIIAHRDQHAVPLVVGVGALFDFVSGGVIRAPAWVRRMRLEWLFRLGQEPKRLARRYSIDLVTFFMHCRRTHRAEQRSRTSSGSVA